MAGNQFEPGLRNLPKRAHYRTLDSFTRDEWKVLESTGMAYEFYPDGPPKKFNTKKKAPTPGKAMVALQDVTKKLRELGQNTALSRWERVCYQTALALVEKTIDDLRQ